ncbi:MAG: hypothetical protein WBQ94_03475, partial [Terracidiphilus sp.]
MKRWLWLLLMIASPALAQYGRYDYYLTNAQGQAISGAQVYLLTQPANTASLTPQALTFGSSSGSGTAQCGAATAGQLTQPAITDGFGHACFYALPGGYTVCSVSQYTGLLCNADQNIQIATNVMYLNIPCDGVTDNSTALNNAFQTAATVALSGTANQLTNGPLIYGPQTGKGCGYANTLNVPDILNVNLNVQELPALGAQTGLRVYDDSGGIPAGSWTGTIVGCGSSCTGSMVEPIKATGYKLNGPMITGSGGHAVNIVNTERGTCDSALNIIANAQSVNIFGPSNEWTWGCKILDNGVVNALNGNPQYIYSPNYPGGTVPAAGSPFYPVNDTAGMILDGVGDFTIPSAGSIKGSYGLPMLWVQHSTVALNGGYTEDSGGSPGEMVGGPTIYTATLAAMATSTTNVLVNTNSGTVDYGTTVLDPATIGPTRLLQHYWIDSCTDAVNVGFLNNFVIYPTDYAFGSTSPSSLGGGIEKGQFERVTGSAYCNPAAPALQMIARGQAGGCSNPPTCSLHAAIAWPIGAFTAESVGSGPSTLTVPNSHLDAYDGPPAGFNFYPDNSTGKTAAEGVIGNVTDPYQVPPGCSTTQSKLILTNNETFNDGTSGSTSSPGIGLFWA